MQDFEDQFLFAQTGGAGDAQVFSDRVQVLNAHVLQLDQVECGRAVLGYGLRVMLTALTLSLGWAAALFSAFAAVVRTATLTLVAAFGASEVRSGRSDVLWGRSAARSPSSAGGAADAVSRAATFSAGAAESLVFSVFSCGGADLPAVVCFRYRLPNFPHSPACHGRARQRLGATVANGGQSPMCVRLVEFVHLRGDHHILLLMRLQPLLQFQIRGHPTPPAIQNDERQLERRPI